MLTVTLIINGEQKKVELEGLTYNREVEMDEKGEKTIKVGELGLLVKEKHREKAGVECIYFEQQTLNKILEAIG